MPLLFFIIVASIIVILIMTTRRARFGGPAVNEPARWPEKIPLLPFLIFAATGLVLSVIVHTLAFFSVTLPIKDAVFALHMGIFVIWIPVVALNQGRGR